MLGRPSIFGVGLLDDLHTYFPDILYRPEQFNSVQSLLRYIQQQARTQFNPFDRGQQMYTYAINNLNANQLVTPIPIMNPMPPTAAATTARTAAPTTATAATAATRTAATAAVAPTVAAPAAVAPTTTTTTTRFPDLSGSFLNPQNAWASAEDFRTPVRARSTNRMSILLPDGPAPLFQPSSNSHGLANIVAALFGADNLLPPDSFNHMEPVYISPSAEDMSANTFVSRLAATSPENCAICQDTMEQGEDVRTIRPCGHTFHRGCIDEWFNSSVRCPNCRVDIRTPS